MRRGGRVIMRREGREIMWREGRVIMRRECSKLELTIRGFRGMFHEVDVRVWPVRLAWR